MSETIIKGDELMLFDKHGHSIAYATSHTYTITGNASDISSKDHGVWSGKDVISLNWEITSENLFTEEHYDDLFVAMVNGEPVELYFTLKKESDPNKSVVDGDYEYWTRKEGKVYYGKANITSLTANANTGENATFSVTLTGTGEVANISVHTININNQTLQSVSAGTDVVKIKDWTVTDTSNTGMGTSNYIEKKNYVTFRNNSSDKSVYQEFTNLEKGTYEFTISFFSTYETDLSINRNYGYPVIYIYNTSGTIRKTIEIGKETGFISKGKSEVQLTANDYSATIDGKTYYMPYYTSEDSVMAYLRRGLYEYTETFTISKGEKIRIKLGQTYGGTKTHVVYGFPSLTYNE